MTSTLPRRVTAVTALAVTAFSGVALAGSVGSASAAAKAHTSLSIRAARSAINPGGGDTIAGDLRSPRGQTENRQVTLLARPAGATGWTTEATNLTGRGGGVGFNVTPATTTRYRLVFNGNNFEQASHSGVVGVRVLSSDTSLVASVSAVSIQKGDSDTVHGALSVAGTPLVGTVELHAAVGNGKLALIGSQTTAADGSVNFSVTPAASTHYVLVFRATAANKYARSARVTVHVRQSTSLSIRARGNQKKEFIGGDLRGANHALRGRPIMLQERASGPNAWTTVATRKTGKNGGVGFKVAAPTASEDYQLVFAGGNWFDGSQSGIVTVNVPTTVTPIK